MTEQKMEARPDRGAGTPPFSRQVNWYSTFEFARTLAADNGVNLDRLPIPGTPRWCDLADDDAAKLLALVLGGVRDALRNDTHQAAMADASREISSAATWSKLGRGRGSTYIPRSKEVA